MDMATVLESLADQIVERVSAKLDAGGGHRAPPPIEHQTDGAVSGPD